MRDVEVINENLRCALAAFSRVNQTGETVAAPGLSLVYAGVPHGLFNTALLTAMTPGPHGDFAELLANAERHFAPKSVPWSVWFCEELLTAEERRKSKLALAMRGMKLIMEAPGMIASEVRPIEGGAGPLRCVRVGNEQTRLEFSRVMSAAYQVPEPMSLDVYGSATLWSGPAWGWVGYAGDRAVSTAMIVIGGDAIGVYALATHPQFQRKGFGETLMRHAIDRARIDTGVRRSVLQSSAAGYSLYVRMGYRAVTRFLVYVTG
ncbi:MAG: GNAT family N-acetyltransferase [Acidobacteria bacterium]|nr:GNAT family N-acetyltransferase [Acidobacteriota bacterium]